MSASLKSGAAAGLEFCDSCGASAVELLELLDRTLDVALDQSSGGRADRPEQRAAAEVDSHREVTPRRAGLDRHLQPVFGAADAFAGDCQQGWRVELLHRPGDPVAHSLDPGDT